MKFEGVTSSNMQHIKDHIIGVYKDLYRENDAQRTTTLIGYSTRVS